MYTPPLTRLEYKATGLNKTEQERKKLSLPVSDPGSSKFVLSSKRLEISALSTRLWIQEITNESVDSVRDRSWVPCRLASGMGAECWRLWGQSWNFRLTCRLWRTKRLEIIRLWPDRPAYVWSLHKMLNCLVWKKPEFPNIWRVRRPEREGLLDPVPILHHALYSLLIYQRRISLL